MLFWPVEADRAFGLVDDGVTGVDIAEVDMKLGRNRVVVADYMDSDLVELVERRDSHIDLEEEEVAVVEEDI